VPHITTCKHDDLMTAVPCAESNVEAVACCARHDEVHIPMVPRTVLTPSLLPACTLGQPTKLLVLLNQFCIFLFPIGSEHVFLLFSSILQC
jgi:hypothetical protein